VIDSQRMLIALSLATAFIFTAPTAGAQSSARDASRKGPKTAVVGTWLARVTPDPAPPSAPPNPPPFDELLTFTADGAVLETDAAFPPFAASPGHGSWVFVSRGVFDATYVKFLFDQQGQVSGTVRVRMRITLSSAGDALSSTDEVDFLGPAGNVLFTSTGLSQASRVAAEPFE
jgi:hypothetical protein